MALEKAEKQPPSFISDQTAISISLAIALASFAFWLSSIQSATSSNTKMIEQLADETERHDVYMRDIVQRLSRIEGKVDELKEHIKKR